MELDPERGAIRSLIDRQTGRELVNANQPYALGQWLYVTGGDHLPNRLVQYSTVAPIPDLTVHPARRGRLVKSGQSGLGAMATLESETERFPRIETEIVLPNERKEVRLTFRVSKTGTLAKEAAYVAFPWALSEPRFRLATQNGWVDPARDMLPGACLEWFTVQDWVAAEAPGQSVTWSALDAPLVTLGDIVRGTWPAQFGSRPANVFSYVMSNYTPEGYAASQEGDFTFRYVITSAPQWSAAAAARFGAESLTPLEPNEITRSDKLSAGRGGESGQRSGIQIAPPEVQLSAWKRAEDGRGLIARLVETGGRNTEAHLSIPGHRIQRAFRCTAVEDDQEPLEVIDGAIRTSVPAYGIATVRLEVNRSP